MATENPLVILVVEDEATVRDFVARILVRKGYAVRCAADGQAAADLFHDDPEGVGLLLTDLDMPRKNGSQLIYEMRSIRPELPVLVMSGSLDEWSEELLGIPCIAKPFTLDTLLRAVEKYLKTGEAAVLAT